MDEVEIYRQILLKDPGSQVVVELAEALFEKSRYAEAIETCEKGLRLHPHDLRARVILGLSYLRTGVLDRAESELLKARGLLEINAVAYEGLAELYERKGEAERSARYRKAYEALRSWETAVAPELEQAAEVEPKMEALDEAEVATVTMAELYAKQGHLDKAAAVYRRILKASPGVAAVEERLAELERGSKVAHPDTKLIAMLEELRNNLKKRSSTGSIEISNQGEGVDSNKLVAVIRKLAQEKGAP
jgi:tetratricopeptide (TPR) repeat protein